MMSFEQIFVNEVESVIKYNRIQGKKAPFSSIDYDKQTERVDEESKELFDHLDTLTNGGINHEIMVKIMDDICDIAVTLSFQCHMLGKSPEVRKDFALPTDSVKILSQFLTHRDDPQMRLSYFIQLAKWITHYPQTIGCEKFDVLGAFSRVNDNNMSKLVPLDTPNLEQIIEDTLKKYEGEDITLVKNEGRLAFQRILDQKNMKPSTFVDVDISEYVVV